MEVKVHPYGLLVTGLVPLMEFGKLSKQARRHLKVKESALVLPLQLGRRLRGTVFTTAELADKWTAELDLLPVPSVTGLKWLDTWIDRGEVGASSATIAEHLSSAKWSDMGMTGPGKPMDSDDFGRCHKLLELARENGHNWRERLFEFPPPGWERLVEAWGQLTLWYVRVEYAVLDAALLNLARGSSIEVPNG